jgi:phospholipid/cholesterol/gamma-HCH transport system ATP-binding protein
MITLEAQNVSIQFEGKLILQNVNLKIQPYETLVLIGPSGAGKTVLLKILAGIIKPSSGEVLVNGEDWQEISNSHRHDLARKVGMLFQQGALFDTLSCLENVEFPLKEHTDYEGEKLQQYAKELLNMVNLSDAYSKIPSELSGGMQRRLGIARALALHPELIFYDDPVAGQDPMQADQMLNLINKFKDDYNATVVMVSSSMRAAFKMATRIAMVVDQQLIITGSPEETKNHPDPRVHQFINGLVEGPLNIN